MFKDRMLVGIVTGVVLLIVAAFTLALVNPAAEYLSEDSASDAAHNYVLALEQKDYEKAHSYITRNLLCYPKDADRLAARLSAFPGGISWQILSERSIAPNEKQVSIQITRFRRTFLFFSDTNQSIVQLNMRFENNGWKVVNTSGYYQYIGVFFSKCWLTCQNCNP